MTFVVSTFACSHDTAMPCNVAAMASLPDLPLFTVCWANTQRAGCMQYVQTQVPCAKPCQSLSGTGVSSRWELQQQDLPLPQQTCKARYISCKTALTAIPPSHLDTFHSCCCCGTVMPPRITCRSVTWQVKVIKNVHSYDLKRHCQSWQNPQDLLARRLKDSAAVGNHSV